MLWTKIKKKKPYYIFKPKKIDTSSLTSVGKSYSIDKKPFRQNKPFNRNISDSKATQGIDTRKKFCQIRRATSHKRFYQEGK